MPQTAPTVRNSRDERDMDTRQGTGAPRVRTPSLRERWLAAADRVIDRRREVLEELAKH